MRICSEIEMVRERASERASEREREREREKEERQSERERGIDDCRVGSTPVHVHI